MELEDLYSRAVKLKIKNYKNMDKLQLIRSIQVSENNFQCFGTADIYCDQIECMFREDCLNKGY